MNSKKLNFKFLIKDTRTSTKIELFNAEIKTFYLINYTTYKIVVK